MIRSRSLALLASLACLALPAMAQTTASNAGASSGSSSVAGAGAQSGSAAVITQNWSSPPEQRIIYGGGYSSSTSATIRNTPDAHAPAIFGGANPCVIGASAGGSVAGFGLSLGLSRNDPGCERRNLAVLAHQMGHRELAQEILCGSEDVRAARARIGQPCLGDPPPQNRVVAGVLPASVPAPAPVYTPVRVSRPDWCDTASAMERRTRSVCN